MRAPADRRTLVTLATAVALVVLVFVLADPGGEVDQPAQSRGKELTTSAGSAAAAPTSSPAALVTFDDFCAAFYVFAQAHTQNVEQQSDASLERVRQEGEAFLEVGLAMPMSDLVRKGFEGFVADVMEESTEATPEEQAEFSNFLTTACPP